MGNKTAKQYLMKRKSQGKNGVPEGSDEDLAEFLAALSNMANRGSKPMSDGFPTPQRLPHAGVGGRYSAPPSTSFNERRRRLKRSKALSDDVAHQGPSNKPEVGAFLQDDNGDWAEMRQWLVWCMQSSLRDDLEMYRKQSSFDSNSET